MEEFAGYDAWLSEPPDEPRDTDDYADEYELFDLEDRMTTDTAHAIYVASARQIAGLELEWQAHLQQIAGLVDERDALREQCNGLAIMLQNARTKLDYYRKLYAGQIKEGDA